MPVLVQLSGLKLRALHRTRAQGLDGDAFSDGSSYATLAKQLAPYRRPVGMQRLPFMPAAFCEFQIFADCRRLRLLAS